MVTVERKFVNLQTKNSLHGDEHGRDVESFEKDFCSLLSILTRIQCSLCKQNGMLSISSESSSLPFPIEHQNRFSTYVFWGCLQLLISMTPNVFHVSPISHDTVFHRIFDFQQTSQGLCLSTNEVVTLHSTSHHRNMFGSSNTIEKIRWLVRPNRREIEKDGGRARSTYYAGRSSLGCSAPANPAFRTPEPCSY